jgi:hypothetical protein
MSIIHSTSITNLEVIDTGYNIVSKIVVKWTSYDDTDPQKTTIESVDKYEVETHNVSPDSDEFIPFKELTEEIVRGWISDQFNDKSIIQNHEHWIDSLLNQSDNSQPTWTIFSKDVPW